MRRSDDARANASQHDVRRLPLFGLSLQVAHEERVELVSDNPLERSSGRSTSARGMTAYPTVSTIHSASSIQEAGGGGGGRLIRHRMTTMASSTTSPRTANVFMIVLAIVAA